ncbi:hypothetical protein BGX34_007777 [Mortierella sp. NVP85]|nr:hypothetical protein BGX34_007777 [Mortierella sp. NVP85]
MNQDSVDAAYMSLLIRNIQGVGNNSIQQTPSAATAQIANKDLTDKQINAIRTLDEALKDALFVSEGEEPFQTVHIVPKQSIALDASNAVETKDTASHKPLPTDAEFVQLLAEEQLIPDDEDGQDEILCERSTDLSSILDNPGCGHITKALQDLFGKDLTSDENKNVALYRVTLPSSATRVHLWVLGWVDQHLLGLHTISIES